MWIRADRRGLSSSDVAYARGALAVRVGLVQESKIHARERLSHSHGGVPSSPHHDLQVQSVICSQSEVNDKVEGIFGVGVRRGVEVGGGQDIWIESAGVGVGFVEGKEEDTAMSLDERILCLYLLHFSSHGHTYNSPQKFFSCSTEITNGNAANPNLII